jgi:hypothetical protein
LEHANGKIEFGSNSSDQGALSTSRWTVEKETSLVGDAVGGVKIAILEEEFQVGNHIVNDGFADENRVERAFWPRGNKVPSGGPFVDDVDFGFILKFGFLELESIVDELLEQLPGIAKSTQLRGSGSENCGRRRWMFFFLFLFLVVFFRRRRFTIHGLRKFTGGRRSRRNFGGEW